MRSINWDDEFANICLSDDRLNCRFHSIMNGLSNQPTAPINQTCTSWYETKAAYRFFANDKVKFDEILRCHQEQTALRLRKHPVILSIQDSSILDYNHHPATRGLGNIMKYENIEAFGLIMHTTMAVTPAGIPLGILQQQLWAREKTGKRYDRNHKKQPIELKESGKWIEGLTKTVELCPQDALVVTIGDRESDIYDLFDRAIDLKTNLLLRVRYNRNLDGIEQKLWPHMQKQKVKGKLKIEVSTTEGKVRIAHISVRIKRVTLVPPYSSRSEKKIRLYMVYVTEDNPPKKIEPVEWMLACTIPITSRQEAVEKIGWYKLRWTIEQWHRVLKSGCRVEHCKLATADKLKRYLTMMSVVAWRILLLSRLSREEPNSSCESVLSKHEWQALHCKINKTEKIPEKAPSVEQATIWIARLGGYLARKNDGPPGPTAIWRGWQRLQDFSDAFLIFHPETYG